ncbi:LOW QUALITY PROTEIN: Cellulose_synt domain-containing protein, partial [Cephalotus follicularis]
MAKDICLPLFETKSAKGRILFQMYAASLVVRICLIYDYRVSYLPVDGGIEWWAWIGLFLAELWLGFCLLMILVRLNPVHRYTFRDRLSQRYEKDLPGIDIFVCTADPSIEPPIMVINTVLSVMAYDYPQEKLSVYLSDDGGSNLTFYALLEASRFSKIWLPFCKKFKIEPRSPEAYFCTAIEPLDDPLKAREWHSIKKSYEEMKMLIETTTKLRQIPKAVRKEHKGFREWDFVTSQRDHQTILQILIDGRDPKAMDIEGQPLPTLVYLSREKRPQYHHNFKAGAMNALIRTSSRISNSPLILNVDCDMYSNNSESVRDALCFFMDECQGHNIAYVQFPQRFANLTKNDVYASSLIVLCGAELEGFDGNGGPSYIGSGCFHRRVALCGENYNRECKVDWKSVNHQGKVEESASVLEETCKVLASCTYEEDTEWGKEMGLKYGCPVEDAITGLCIQCRGWRSILFNPERKGFLGVAPTTLLQSLVQHKRWAEGHLQIFLSKYNTLWYGHGRIPLKLQLSYLPYSLWAANCWPTLYYAAVPSLCLLRGISLFPKISSPWILPFVYAIFANSLYSLGEFLWWGGTVQGWWNDQRMWLFKRTTSYLFGFIDTILNLLGFAKSAFAITAKVVDEEVTHRYEKELMEFGNPSPMLNIIATIALLNIISFVGGIRRVVIVDAQTKVFDQFAWQILLCGVLVYINMPVYQGAFFRKDNGRMPTSTTYWSILCALLACAIAM